MHSKMLLGRFADCDKRDAEHVPLVKSLLKTLLYISSNLKYRKNYIPMTPSPQHRALFTKGYLIKGLRQFIEQYECSLKRP